MGCTLRNDGPGRAPGVSDERREAESETYAMPRAASVRVPPARLPEFGPLLRRGVLCQPDGGRFPIRAGGIASIVVVSLDALRLQCRPGAARGRQSCAPVCRLTCSIRTRSRLGRWRGAYAGPRAIGPVRDDPSSRDVSVHLPSQRPRGHDGHAHRRVAHRAFHGSSRSPVNGMPCRGHRGHV